MNLTLSGWIFELIGVFILVLISTINSPHQKIFGEKEWWKRYWWSGWRPLFKIRPPSKKPYWRIKWTHKVVRYGIIPPNHQWNIIGFLCILVGVLLQIKGSIN